MKCNFFGKRNVCVETCGFVRYYLPACNNNNENNLLHLYNAFSWTSKRFTYGRGESP